MTDAGGRSEDGGAGVLDYLKEAFLYRWNLLFFAGAAVAAIISPTPDVLLPLVGAGELLYLAGLTAVPKFRAAIDAKVHARSRPAEVTAAPATPSIQHLLAGLRPEARHRFQNLRDRCLEMRRIARGVSGEAARVPSEVDRVRTPALDRLLWVFLRLLSSQQGLQRFLDTTDEAAIEARLRELRGKEEGARERGDERILRSLVDSIATTELRLDNYRKAASNAEFVAVELDRIEGKIQALTEMSVSHQDPDYISSQVDSVAESMQYTERAIRDLQHITGLGDDLETAPAIIDAPLETA